MTKTPRKFLLPKGKCGPDNNMVNQLEYLANGRTKCTLAKVEEVT